jgi:predicted esterase
LARLGKFPPAESSGTSNILIFVKPENKPNSPKMKLPSRCALPHAILFLGLSAVAHAVPWTSAATGGSITATVTEPNPVVTTPALVVYLKGLTCERIGQEPDASILASFTASGYRVVELNYAGHANATAPFLNADVLKIRNEIGSATFPGSSGINTKKNQCYILCEGYRLMRNVPYFLNDRTVYNGAETTNAELRMDIAYPSQPSRGVPIVMEYSCSNSYFGNEDDRMNNAAAFTGTTDTILEGAPAAGIAWAMADQPKYRDWSQPKSNGYNFSGFETNSDKDFNINYDTSKKVRSSIRVLREVGATLGLSGNIAIHGFSRGASAGSLAVGDLRVPAIDSVGYSTSLSGRAQAVLLGSGLYDYTHSGGTITGDPAGKEVDIYSRFVTAWGTTASNFALWQVQGAPYYMATAASAPVFLSYNTDDAAYYVYQAQLMETKLTSLGVPFQKVTGTGAHKVTTTPSTLTSIYNFFKFHSNTLPNKPGRTLLGNYDSTAQLLDLTIDANGNGAAVTYAICTDGTPRKWVQANGTVGTNPVWRTLADWGAPVRVGPLTNLTTVRFTVIAYDPAKFTTVQNSDSGPAAPPISDFNINPSTGEVSFTWPSPAGVTDPVNLTDTVFRSPSMNNDWTTVPGAVITITGGTVTFKDPTPPAGKAFYRIARP